MKILKVRVDDISIEKAVGRVNNWLETDKSKIFTIVTPNPEVIVQAQDDKKLRQIINSADLAVADGYGLRFAGVKNTVHGIDLMQRLCKRAAERGWTVGLYGGREGVAKQALEKLQSVYPALEGWAISPGEIKSKEQRAKSEEQGSGLNRVLQIEYNSIDKEIDSISQKIEKTKTKMLFIGLGVPKQEYFAQAVGEKLPITDYRLPIAVMVVGGSFDEISGKVRPAPEWVSKLGLKWLWRLIWQPWRIRRQRRLVKYMYLLAKERTR